MIGLAISCFAKESIMSTAVSLKLSTPIIKFPKAALNATKVPIVRTAAPPDDADGPIDFTTIKYKAMVEQRVIAGLMTLFQLL